MGLAIATGLTHMRKGYNERFVSNGMWKDSWGVLRRGESYEKRYYYYYRLSQKDNECMNEKSDSIGGWTNSTGRQVVGNSERGYLLCIFSSIFSITICPENVKNEEMPEINSRMWRTKTHIGKCNHISECRHAAILRNSSLPVPVQCSQFQNKYFGKRNEENYFSFHNFPNEIIPVFGIPLWLGRRIGIRQTHTCKQRDVTNNTRYDGHTAWGSRLRVYWAFYHPPPLSSHCFGAYIPEPCFGHLSLDQSCQLRHSCTTHVITTHERKLNLRKCDFGCFSIESEWHDDEL